MSTTWKKKFELRVSDDFKLNTVSFSVILLMIGNENRLLVLYSYH